MLLFTLLFTPFRQVDRASGMAAAAGRPFAVLVTAAPAGAVDRPTASSRAVATVRVVVMILRPGQPVRRRAGLGSSGGRNRGVRNERSLSPSG